MRRGAGIRVGGKDWKEEKGAGVGDRGSEAPIPFLPSFLPGLFWAPQPLTTGVGEDPPAPVCRAWARETGLPGVRRGGRTGDIQGQTYPLIQIEGLWGAGQREEEEQMVSDPRVLSPILATVP